MVKPAYAIPKMAEIREFPWNGLRVASTFAGCGGSSTGYRIAGYRVAWASEFIEEARQTYAANKAPETILDGRDIREVQPEDILKATGLAQGELDVLDGSPPCSSFSTAGVRDEGWGKVRKYSDKAQRTDDLFYEFSRILRGIRPRAFVAENVSGLVKGKAKGHFLEIIADLRASGYKVEASLINAEYCGVPQVRVRLIFVGIREDLGIEPVFPEPLPFTYSVQDALANCPGPLDPETDITRFAIGAEWDKLRPGMQSEKYFNLVRVNPRRPCPTVLASHGNPSTAGITHFSEKRKFSIAELRRLCGFPDDFVLTGTFVQKWERLGRAVPPPLMARVAETLAASLKGAP